MISCDRLYKKIISSGGGLFFAVLVVAFFLPALFGDKTFFHGESLYHGLPILASLKNALMGEGTVLWFDKVYGGHPLFAESQGEFVYPPNIFLVLLLEPIKALNVGYFLHMILSGFGMYVLARHNNVGRIAANCAALALVFSGYWMASLNNITINHALAWTPWLLFGFDSLTKSPGLRSATLAGVVSAMAIFSGYPQIPFAAVIYCLVNFFVSILSRDERLGIKQHWRPRAQFFLWAALICGGLAAIQIVPLLQIASYSHRASGVYVKLYAPLEFSVRGMLFSFRHEQDSVLFSFPVQESLIVVIVASSLFLMKKSVVVWGHIVATLFLLNLGADQGSPILKFIYDHHLLPGLHYFRIMHPFFSAGLVGLALCFAFAINKLANGELRLLAEGWSAFRGPLIYAAIFFACVWLAIIVRFSLPQVNFVHYWMAAFALVSAAVLIAIRRERLVSVLILLSLTGEIAFAQFSKFPIEPVSILSEPESLRAIQRDADYLDYKMMDLSFSAARLGMVDPRDSDLPIRGRRVVENMSAMGNLLWGISSIEGASALPQPERVLLEDAIHGEAMTAFDSAASAKASLPIINALSIRYVFADHDLDMPGFEEVLTSRPYGVRLYKNLSARPRFQTYASSVVAASTEEAISRLRSEPATVLVLARPSWINPQQFDKVVSYRRDFAAALRFRVLQASSIAYELEILDNSSGWLFLADANYPGWHAYLDGNEVPVLNGQVLGKAVRVEPGVRKVKLVFRPVAWFVGAAISLVSVLLMVLMVFIKYKREIRCGILALVTRSKRVALADLRNGR